MGCGLSLGSCWGSKILPRTLINWYSERTSSVSRTNEYMLGSHSRSVDYEPGNVLTAVQGWPRSSLRRLCEGLQLSSPEPKQTNKTEGYGECQSPKHIYFKSGYDQDYPGSVWLLDPSSRRQLTHSSDEQGYHSKTDAETGTRRLKCSVLYEVWSKGTPRPWVNWDFSWWTMPGASSTTEPDGQQERELPSPPCAVVFIVSI